MCHVSCSSVILKSHRLSSRSCLCRSRGEKPWILLYLSTCAKKPWNSISYLLLWQRCLPWQNLAVSLNIWWVPSFHMHLKGRRKKSWKFGFQFVGLAIRSCLNCWMWLMYFVIQFFLLISSKISNQIHFFYSWQVCLFILIKGNGKLETIFLFTCMVSCHWRDFVRKNLDICM